MSWYSVDLPAARPGELVPIEVAGQALAAVHCSGSWRLFEDRCSHARCAFTKHGVIEDGVLICQCHGSEFSLETGEVLLEPAEEPLQLFAIRGQDGAYEVELQ